MIRHVIVEGPDGSGKSRLIEMLGLERLHTVAFRPEYGDPMEWYHRRILFNEQSEMRHTSVGFDRLWLSELIYGPVLRDRSAITEQQAKLLKITYPNIPVIVCLPPWSITLNATRSRPWPDYQTDDYLLRCYKLFKLYADTELVDFVYDWTKNELRASRKLPFVLRKLINATA